MLFPLPSGCPIHKDIVVGLVEDVADFVAWLLLLGTCSAFLRVPIPRFDVPDLDIFLENPWNLPTDTVSFFVLFQDLYNLPMWTSVGLSGDLIGDFWKGSDR